MPVLLKASRDLGESMRSYTFTPIGKLSRFMLAIEVLILGWEGNESS